MNKKPTWRQNKLRILATALLPLLFALSAPVSASLIEVSFTATISNDGGTTTDDIDGQFTLDSSLLWGIGVGGVNGIIDSGSATLFGSAETADAGSGFSFVSAALRTGYGALTIIADYGGGLFSLELAADTFFTTANVFDDLVPELTLADLRAFSPGEVLGTTRFVHFFGLEEWEGALTSLSIQLVSEPGTLWLLLFVPGIIVWGRRRAV